MRKLRTWVLVADQAKARILAKEGAKGVFHQIADSVLESRNRPAREIASDRPGRTFDSASPGRHAKEPSSDPRRLEKQKFIGEVAARLNAGVQRDQFDRLVIVAPPAALGSLRPQLSRQVREKLTTEIARDLVHLKEPELVARLKQVVR